MELWNNASTGMKVLIVIILVAAVIGLGFILTSAIGSPQEPEVHSAPAATATPVPPPEPSEPPVAVISGPTQTIVGQPVTLSATDSKAAEGSQIVSYFWDLGDGMQSTNDQVTHTYAAAGRYDVELMVADNNGLEGNSNIKMEAEEAPRQPGLEDQVWMKVSVLEGTEITATFQRGQVSGSSGCNDYNGFYEIDGNAISISPLSTTRKACPQPVMDQESAYLAALAAATTYQVQGNSLTIRTTQGPLQYVATGN